MQFKTSNYFILKKSSFFRITLVVVSIVALFSGCTRLMQPAQNLTEAGSTRVNNSQTGAARTNQFSPNVPPSQAGATYSPVVKRVSPGVVTVQSTRRMRAPQQYPFMDDPRFREFFRENPRFTPQPQAQIQRGLGSGVVVTDDGYILTNHHVNYGAEEIKVGFNDRRTFDAKVVGTDPPSDLAVLKIDADDLPLLALGNSDTVEIGDVVLAVGNPLGLAQTVTAGIISAKGRSTGVSDGNFEDFLQTDAPINQGNSGGALVNTNGEVIGINSQILSPSGGNIGIGFAIPSNMAKNVMQQLIGTGAVRRGQLGVVVQQVTSDIAQSMRLPETRGVVVSQVLPGSAAARGGIQQGDVITAFNGEPINESNELRNRVATTPPGANVTLTIYRASGEQQLRLSLGELNNSSNRRNE
jgi:Do/DeqQ family serine protease